MSNLKRGRWEFECTEYCEIVFEEDIPQKDKEDKPV